MSNRDHIRDSIKTEVAIQAKQEVDIQLQDHIPFSLTQQLVDSKKQIADIRVALENSSAFPFLYRTVSLTLVVGRQKSRMLVSIVMILTRS
jgi:hypothetical protein